MAMKTQKHLGLALAGLIGFLFVLPHAVRILCLGSVKEYSPFSARTASGMVWDETFMYGAQVNYTYRHRGLAYDLDAFEHRSEPVPYSILPIEIEVIFARLFHSVDAAQIVFQFFFPALTAWMLISLFVRFSASRWLAAFLALAVLVLSFSLRTIYDGAGAVLHSGLHSNFTDTLQAARNPHPNMSFPLFLAACMSLGAALHRRSRRFAFLAGILGGLLFYTYVYYAIPWSGCIALVTLYALCFWRDRVVESFLCLATTAVVGSPFLLWTRAAAKAGGYIYRSNRLGMLHSISLSPLGKNLTIFWLSVIPLWAIGWGVCRIKIAGISEESRRVADVAVLVCVCAALAGIAAMDMQVVTGFNIQPEIHYPHMLIQPATIIMTMVIVLVLTERFRGQKKATASAVLFVGLLALCAVEQVSAAVNSAPAHRILPAEAALFTWLNRNTSPNDVVATTNLSLCIVLPVFTHNYSLLANGSRTSGSDDEVLDRFLLANALTSTPESRLVEELNGSGPHEPWDPNPLITSYAEFLYERSPYREAFRPSLQPPAIAMASERYRRLNLAQNLERFRVNYVYTMNGQHPAIVPGWQTQDVLDTSQGTLWKLSRKAASSG
jgi:hypothetical protein